MESMVKHITFPFQNMMYFEDKNSGEGGGE